jgi:hypothetical protein
MRARWPALAVVLLGAGTLHASGDGADTAGSNKSLFPPYEEIPEVVSFLSPLIIPKLFQDCARLKDYIRSDEFGRFRTAHGDLRAVDAVFDRAMRLSWNNAYEALCISLFATMDHRNFGIRFPFLGALLWMPLSSEFQEDFDARVSALPKALYPDTPPGLAGDRDKLQHFFGSAFFTYLLESPQAANRIGDFVEEGEEMFVVGGVDDVRDVRSNHQGEKFGLALLNDRNTLPSPFFRPGLPPGETRPPDEADSLMEVR